MTTPIPEASVEAAAIEHGAISFTTQGMVCRCNERFVSVAEYNLHVIRAALTAARPLMEAEIRGQVAADCRVEAENVDLEVPNAYREGTRDGYLSAATIAERTQR